MKQAILIFILLITTTTSMSLALAEVPLEASAFSSFVSNMFRLSLPGAKVSVSGPLTLKIVVQKNGNADPHTASLVALHDLCMREPDNCDMAVRQHVADITSYYAHRDDALDATTLRVAVRPGAYVAQARKMWGENALPARPLVGDLWILCVADLPTAIRVLKPDDLQILSINAEQALAKAQDNTHLDLEKSIADLRKAAFTDRNLMGFTGNSYMSSLLAFDDIWPNVAKSMGGHLIAMAPAPDVLIVAREDTAASVSDLKQAGQEVMSKSLHPLSGAIFRWGDKGWATVAP